MSEINSTDDRREVTPNGEPSRVLYSFENQLDHPNYRWLLWKGLHYEEIDIDFPIGNSIFFPNPMLEHDERVMFF